jgi:beta-lysine 5,6-aminomutase beta subunit
MSAAPGELIRPYGDRRDDGVVQLSFVLPLAAGERAREAAAEVARRMGLADVQVAWMERAADAFTFFVVYGRTAVAVDAAALEVPEVVSRKLGFDELNALVARELGRRIVVLGACTGSDAHAVGIDAIMNMKGYAGDYGLERYPMLDARNLGAQVDNAALARAALDARADVVLVSQVVTQRDVHKENARQLVEELERLGLRRRLVLVLGGPRLDHRTALALGYDAGFGPGTLPSDVANFVVGEVLRRAGRVPATAGAPPAQGEGP